MKVRVVLPAYNEQASIGSLLQRFEALYHDFPVPFELLVVNDSSKDDTATVVIICFGDSFESYQTGSMTSISHL